MGNIHVRTSVTFRLLSDAQVAARLLGCSESRDAVQSVLIAQIRALLLAPDAQRGWAPVVRASSAPMSGDGVAIEGSCAVGTVVAIYPGVSIFLTPPEHD